MARILVWFFFCCMGIGNANESINPYPLPEEWELGNRLAPTKYIDVILSLKRLGRNKLVARAMEVSDPRSSSYGQYLNNSELIKAIEVNPESRVIVENWLHSYNMEYNLGPTLDMIHIHASVAQVEKLFQTTIYLVRNKITNQITHRASSLQISSSVSQHITSIFGLHGLPLPSRTIKKEAAAPYKVTPAVLAKTYKISGVSASRSTTNRQAVAEFQGEYMNKTDLTTFFNQYVPDAKAGDEDVYKFVGVPYHEGEGVEALLDIEYIMGVAPGIKTEFWEYPDRAFCTDLVTWTQTILGTDNPPLVHSVSYGWQGELSALGCKTADIDTIDAEFQKLAAKGITIIFASGDSGSGQKAGQSSSKMYPSWPASSPWVTAVGSTRFVNNTVGTGPEMATDQFGSGGGFSTMFTAPSWQKNAVDSYFTNEPASKLPSSDKYPRGGRATPDISALGEGYQVISRGRVLSVGGTSASAPAFAGMVSLLNEALLTASKPALGFLNPFIYQHPEAFMDVTVGSNRIDRSGRKIADGWDCVKGWDPATGFGTPDFQKLLKAALN